MWNCEMTRSPVLVLLVAILLGSATLALAQESTALEAMITAFPDALARLNWTRENVANCMISLEGRICGSTMAVIEMFVHFRTVTCCAYVGA